MSAERPRDVYAVSELNEILRGLIEDSLPSLWVQGEISNLARPSSGHWYFTLKDDRAQIRCAMFKGANFYVRPPPQNGDAVLLRAKAGVYPARGELQLIVEHLELAGTGALLRAFEELKARLSAEGLFDAALKRPIPATPGRIGLITSASGAAIHDVLTTLARRWPLAQVLLYPVPVQGVDSPPAIVQALTELPQRAMVDVILLVRGGGSIEDLWAFNSEAVARAIRACAVPVVSGVGHEIDTTIADFAADLRAATPTAAAELVAPDVEERSRYVGSRFVALTAQMLRRLQVGTESIERRESRLHGLHPGRRLHERAQRLDELEQRLLRSGEGMSSRMTSQLGVLEQRLQRLDPQNGLRQSRREVDGFHARLHTTWLSQLGTRSTRLARSEALLGSLNPQAVLERGYALARRVDGVVVRDAATLQTGDALDLVFARGKARVAVRKIAPEKSPG